MAMAEARSSFTPLSPITTNISPIYIAVEPNQLIFDNHSKTSSVLLRIINIGLFRIAFRIRTNEPTNYIVMPATGFLSRNESINIIITNLNMSRSHLRHGFIIEAIKAKESDKNRRKIWDDHSIMGDLDSVQCIRIFALRETRYRSDKSKNPEEFDQSTLFSQSETGESSIELMTDEEKSTKINELNKQINNKLEQKRKEYQSLIEAINEVKKTEIDLDRATIHCNDLNKKIILAEDQQKIIKEKIAKIDAVLDTLKTN